MNALDGVLADLVEADRDCAYVTVKRGRLLPRLVQSARHTMIPILRGLRMGGDGLLSGDKAVQDWCHIFAFCFALASVDALVGLGFGRHLGVSAVCFMAACLFYLAGVKWPRIRKRLPSPKVAKPNAVPALPITGRAEWLQLAKDFESCLKHVIAEWYRYGKPPIEARSDFDRRRQRVPRARYDRRALREAGYCRSQQQEKYRC